MIELYIDGGARGNHNSAIPNDAVICILSSNRNILIYEHIGDRTSNQAEYEALIKALDIIAQKSYSDYIIYSDSQIVVNQFNKAWKCKNYRLQQLLNLAWKKSSNLNIKLKWIPRNENIAGQYIENIQKGGNA